jgi:hypothetical protein
MKKYELITKIIRLEESKLNIKVDGQYLREKFKKLDKYKKDYLYDMIKDLKNM